MKKKILVSLMLSVMAVVFIVIPVLASVTIIDTYTSSGVSSNINNTTWLGSSFSKGYSFTGTNLIVRMFRGSSTAGLVWVQIYTADVNDKPVTLIETSAKARSIIRNSDPYDTVANWTDFALSGLKVYHAGQKYVWIAGCTDGTENIGIGYIAANTYADGKHVSTVNSGSTWTESASYDVPFIMKGSYTADTVITTLAAQHNSNATVTLSGYINSMGAVETLTSYLEYGTDTNYGELKNCGEKTRLTNPKFDWNIGKIPVGLTFHYRAYIVDQFGTRINGDDKTFVAVDADAIINTLPGWDADYYSFLTGYMMSTLGEETSVDVSIEIGKTINLELTDVVIEEGVTLPTYQEIQISELDANTKYYFRAKAVGETETYYGKVESIYTNNPASPRVINWISSWFNRWGMGGSGIWWLITAVLMAGVWLIKPLRENKWMACVVDLVILGAAITLSILDIWLVILLAFGAGITVVGLVIRQRTSG